MCSLLAAQLCARMKNRQAAEGGEVLRIQATNLRHSGSSKLRLHSISHNDQSLSETVLFTVELTIDAQLLRNYGVQTKCHRSSGILGLRTTHGCTKLFSSCIESGAVAQKDLPVLILSALSFVPSESNLRF